MSADPYTADELDEDVIGWTYASVENRDQAFTTLLNAAAAAAYTDQNESVIEALREIRSKRVTS